MHFVWQKGCLAEGLSLSICPTSIANCFADKVAPGMQLRLLMGQLLLELDLSILLDRGLLR